MPGPNPDPAARVIARGKERQPADMVEMRAAVKQIEVRRRVGADQFITDEAQPGAAVEDQQMLAAADFDAGRIAAVTHRVGARAGDTAAHAPKSHPKVRRDQRPILAFAPPWEQSDFPQPHLPESRQPFRLTGPAAPWFRRAADTNSARIATADVGWPLKSRPPAKCVR